MIVIHRFCKGSRWSLSFFGIGFILFLSHSVGLSPHLKHNLKNSNRSNFAFIFFNASLGMSKYAFFNLALSIHFDTSENRISEFRSLQSYPVFCENCSGERFSSSCFFSRISSKKASSKENSGFSRAPENNLEISLCHLARIS